MQILGNTLRRFSTNLRTVNVIPVIHVNTGVIVPLINLMTKRYGKVRPRNISCRRKKNQEKDGGKSSRSKNKWQMQRVDGDVSAFSLAPKTATGLKTITESSHLFSMMPCIT